VDMCADPECKYSLFTIHFLTREQSNRIVDQKVNLEFRLPALRDAGILMTSEVHLDWQISGSSKWEGGNRVQRLERLARRESIG
jgi:hypothetical protein